MIIKRALISVSDKTGLVELGKALKHFQVEIISTGGTAKALNDSGVETVSVSDYTGFPEMMDGRLKTLHPRVHGALLGNRQIEDHEENAKTYGIKWIDLLVVNLYPFKQVATRSKKPTWEELIENIDIGGPAMIRAASKNHEYVTVVTDPKDYKDLIYRMKSNNKSALGFEYRYDQAVKAFRHTAIYDGHIAQTLSQYSASNETPKEIERKEFPRFHFIHGSLQQGLRYGENPHQKAAAYKVSEPAEYMPFSESLQGKELSFNNYLDLDAAWKTLLELPPKSCVILKHSNPCGVAIGETEKQCFERALSADPESAFGGIIAISGHVDVELANLISESFFEIVCAQSFDVEAREVFKSKKNLRLILLPEIEQLDPENLPQTDIKKLSGSYLVQEADYIGRFSSKIVDPDVRCVTKKRATDEEISALKLAWVIAKNVKSNAVVIANGTQSLGIGCGEVNRKFAAFGAAERSKAFESEIKVCASDGFFPFPDSISALTEAGVTAIIQPGGSIRDEQVIEACNQAGVSMFFTQARHFRH